MTHAVREAVGDDADDVVRLLDAAMLEFDRERVRRRVDAGDALVAVVEGFGCAGDRNGADDRNSAAATDGDNDRSGADDASTPNERVVGVCVLGEGDGRSSATEIEQIAVHRSRRGRGIGTALVDAAASRSDGPLAARFRERVRPFYESLGFEIRNPEAVDSDRDGDGDPGRNGDGNHDRRDGGSADDRGEGRLRGVLR